MKYEYWIVFQVNFPTPPTRSRLHEDRSCFDGGLVEVARVEKWRGLMARSPTNDTLVGVKRENRGVARGRMAGKVGSDAMHWVGRAEGIRLFQPGWAMR